MFEYFPWAVFAALAYGLIYHPEKAHNAVSAGAVAPLVGVAIQYRRYEKVITRFAYIGLLIYWYVYISGARLHEHHIFSTLLMELARFPQAKYGERDMMGKHWSTNVAEELSMTALNAMFEPYASTHFWKLTILNCFLVFFVFGHHLFQLWMQKAVAKLARWNRNAWRWRELLIEASIQSLLRKLDHAWSRALLRLWWSGWYWLHGYLNERRTSTLAQQLFIIRLVIRSEAAKSLFSYGVRYIFLWSMYIRDLAQFANPDPPEYKYKPLKKPDHIRLLLLHPRFGFRPVSCSLIQGPGMSILFYEAISYTWGSMKPTEEIMVDGCKLEVTKSVYEVLASYSSLFLPKLLWIDAVCIDQNNLEEKALQVPLMQRIYRSADITSVFLGQAPLPDTPKHEHELLLPYRYDSLLRSHAEFCQSAHVVFDLFREFHVLQEQLRGDGTTIYEMHEMVRPSKYKPRVWMALQRLLQHPWFQRVWIVQEVALSSHVQVSYGGDVIDWETMGEAVQKLQRSRNFRLWLEWEHGIQLRHIQYTNMYNILRIDGMREKLHPREKYGWAQYPKMADVLREGFFFRATNPRDQVYGLIALCESPGQLQVDYKMSIEDTYVDAAIELLNIGSVRTVLHAAGLGNRRQHNRALPTWVPDWREAPSYDMINTHYKPLYATSTEEYMNPKKTSFEVINRTSLRISAAFVDTIIELGPVIFATASAESGGTMEEMHRLAKYWQETAAMIGASKLLPENYAHDAPGQTVQEAFGRTMLCDKKHIGLWSNIDKFLPKLAAWEQNLLWLSKCPASPNTAERKQIYSCLLEMDEATEQVESCCGGRRLFITQKGYMGLCPPYTDKGDLVHSVPKLDVALILRRTTSGPLRDGDDFDPSNQYYFVGEGYCHGVSNRIEDSIDGAREICIL